MHGDDERGWEQAYVLFRDGPLGIASRAGRESRSRSRRSPRREEVRVAWEGAWW